MSVSKSQMFFLCRFIFFYTGEKSRVLPGEIWQNCLLTNLPVCGLMTFVYITKTLTEIPLPSDAPESRRLVRAGADDGCGLLPESVL